MVVGGAGEAAENFSFVIPCLGYRKTEAQNDLCIPRAQDK